MKMDMGCTGWIADLVAGNTQFHHGGHRSGQNVNSVAVCGVRHLPCRRRCVQRVERLRRHVLCGKRAPWGSTSGRSYRSSNRGSSCGRTIANKVRLEPGPRAQGGRPLGPASATLSCAMTSMGIRAPGAMASDASVHRCFRKPDQPRWARTDAAPALSMLDHLYAL